MSDFHSSLTDKWLSCICNEASIISEIASTLKPFLGGCGLQSCFLKIFLEFQVRFLCIRISSSELFIYKRNTSCAHCILPICHVEDTVIYTHKEWCFQMLKHLNYYAAQQTYVSVDIALKRFAHLLTKVYKGLLRTTYMFLCCFCPFILRLDPDTFLFLSLSLNTRLRIL